MAPTTMVDRLLAAAQELVASKPRSAAFRRRAVSTAYYAVFHALAKSCARTLIPNARSGNEAYRLIYRALDHGMLRSVLGQSPAMDHPTLRKIGPIVVRLQTERHRADYLPPEPNLFPPSEAQELIDQARLVIDDVEALDAPSRLLLATRLLFRDRKQ